MLEPDNRSRSIVVGLGEVLWDILPSGPRLGGAPTNFAAYAAALGANACGVSAVGTDELGDRAESELKQLSVDTSYLSQVDAPTGTVQVDLSNGQPSYSITENVAWDKCSWSPTLGSFAASVDAVCFGTLFQRSAASRNTWKEFLGATAESCLRVFDVNLRQTFYSDDFVMESLKLANYLKLSNEELPEVARIVGMSCERETFAKSMMENFELQMLMLTAGKAGSFLFTSDESSYVESEDVDVIDTVGAGDAFAAAVVTGVLGNRPLAELHQTASKLAGSVCGIAGAMPKS